MRDGTDEIIDSEVLNFDIDPNYEYDFPASLRILIDMFRKTACDAPESSTIRRNAEFAIDMIMSGPLGEVIGRAPKDMHKYDD